MLIAVRGLRKRLGWEPARIDAEARKHFIELLWDKHARKQNIREWLVQIENQFCNICNCRRNAIKRHAYLHKTGNHAYLGGPLGRC